MRIHRLEKIHGHPWVRAVAEVECNGFLLRGIKIEEHPQGWRLTPPGRKVAGAWQVLFHFCDRQLEADLLEKLRGCLG